MEIGIITVAYNRLESLQRLLRSLEGAYYYEDKVTLIIDIDKSKTDVVEKFADDYVWKHGEKIVVKHNENLGLRNHMLSLGQHFNKFDALVVLEDDLTVSPNYYIYAKQTVDKYKNDDNIAGISLFSFEVNYQTWHPFTPIKDENDVYFANIAASWGEIWLKSQWLSFKEWYNSHNEEFSEMPHLPINLSMWGKSSWLKYHHRYCIEENKYFVFPYTSLSTNNAAAGEHFSRESTIYQFNMQYGVVKSFRLPTLADSTVLYDGFFENKKIPKWLGINNNDICVDLNGAKNNREQKRYWLVNEALPYRVIKRFGLKLRPIDANIYNEIEGNDLFLYDTTVKGDKPAVEYNRAEYNHRIPSIVFFFKSYKLSPFIKEILRHYVGRLKNLF